MTETPGADQCDDESEGEAIREREGGRRQASEASKRQGIRGLCCIVWWRTVAQGASGSKQRASKTMGCKGPKQTRAEQRKLPPAVHALINRLIHGSGPGRLGRGRGLVR
jgi:hypothetical protein